MKKTKPLIRDFFERYNQSQMQNLVFSGMFAVLFSLSIILVTRDVDTRGLMASVANVASTQKYDADIEVTTQGTTSLSILLGNTLEKVDKISTLVILDPEKVTTMSSDNPAVLVENLSSGLWKVTKLFRGETLYPGTSLFNLTTNTVLKDVPITLSDSYFESAGMRYSLTNKGK